MTLSLDIFRALADPTRLRIVALLREMELAVGELAQVLGQSQPRVSHHVRILCDCGVARRRKEGSWVFLCPGAPELMSPVFAMMDALASLRGSDQTVVDDIARLAAVHTARAQAAEKYFSAHAEQWDSIRSLHVPDGAVEQEMLAMLAAKPIGKLVDIGTGTGRMIELFLPLAAHSTGVDRSPEMLRLARARISAGGAEGWQLLQGDVQALPFPDQWIDTAILHQVLHYLPIPERAIQEAGRILLPGGRLLIADFAPHDREELRSRDAHARLGFSDSQISGWLDAAGMQLTETRELAGGKLTVKLWLGTRIAQEESQRP